MFVSENDAGVQHDITLGAGRQAYLVCAEGSLTVATGEGGAYLLLSLALLRVGWGLRLLSGGLLRSGCMQLVGMPLHAFHPQA